MTIKCAARARAKAETKRSLLSSELHFLSRVPDAPAAMRPCRDDAEPEVPP